MSTLCALALDLYIRRMAQQGGTHVRLADLDHDFGVDRKRGRDRAASSAARGPYAGIEHQDLVSQDHIARHSEYEPFKMPQHPGYGLGGGVASRTLQADGYAVPENQFQYDDTSYHGRAGEEEEEEEEEEAVYGRR